MSIGIVLGNINYLGLFHILFRKNTLKYSQELKVLTVVFLAFFIVTGKSLVISIGG